MRLSSFHLDLVLICTDSKIPSAGKNEDRRGGTIGTLAAMVDLNMTALHLYFTSCSGQLLPQLLP
eukprot:763056-Hanusia_phi.AAC.15